MRHPALTRFFAAFLAVLSAITLISGGICIRKATEDREKQNKNTVRLSGKAAEAKELRAELEAMPESYERQNDEYERAKEKYDSEKLSYRKDLSIYTATEAGLKQGAEKLEEGYDALRTGWIAHDNGEKALNDAEAQFLPGYEQYLAGKAQLEEGRRQLEQAEQLKESLPDLALLRIGLNAVRDSEGNLSATLGAIQNTVQNPPADPETGEIDRDALRAQLLTEVGTLSFQLEIVRAKVAEAYGQEAMEQALAPFVAALSEQAAQIADGSISTEELLAAASQLVTAGQGSSGSLSSALDSAEQTLTMLEGLPEMRAQLDQAETALKQGEPMLLQAKEGFETGRRELEKAKQMLIYAEAQLIAGKKELENKQAEQEETKKDLDARKMALEKESRRLEQMLLRIEVYRDKKDRFSNLRYALLADDGISVRVRNGEDLIPAAEEELAQRAKDTEKEFSLRLSAAIGMIVASVFGILAVIQAFRDRQGFPLLFPAALSFAIAAASEAVSFYANRGLIYTVLFVGFFSAALLLLNLKRA